MKLLSPQFPPTGILQQILLSPEQITAFQSDVYAHYQSNPRPMPWRETDDPYRILVSEIMLQQTQVERVRNKYLEFLAEFPTVGVLAAAPLADVLLVWQGLGYNRRALYLKRCAEEIDRFHAGQFPQTVDTLQALPGIGPYTARAVGAFAYGIAEPLIETNIRAVYIHSFFPGREKVCDREIMPLVAATLDRADPRHWYYALMDYGVMLKQAYRNPGRRSRHHTQQSRFEGSNRQLRSHILQEILQRTQLSAKVLAESLTADREMVQSNLDAMQREGLLDKRGRRYCISGKK